MTTAGTSQELGAELPSTSRTKRSLSIRFKLIVPMSLIIMGLIGTSFLATTWLIQRFQHADLREAVERTEQVIEALLATQRQTLIQQAQLVGELPILTTVVEDGDPATIRDSAQTYQTQLQLPVFDVLDSDGEMLVSVQDTPEIAEDMATAALVADALDGEANAEFAWRQQRLVLVAAAPIGVPDEPSGVLRVGRYLDDTLATRIQQLTKAEVSFVGNQEVVGSSLPSEARTALQAALPELVQDISPGDTSGVLTWGNDLVQSMPLRDAGGQLLGHVMLQVSRAAAEAVMAKLQRLFGGVAAAGFFVAVLLTNAVARGIARPLGQMATAASRIACGDLAQRIEYEKNNEIGTLAQGLNHMSSQLRQMLREIADKAMALTTAASELSVVSEQMSSNASGVSDSATTTAAIAKQMSANMDMVSEIAEQSTANTSSVATATEDMTTTISGIAQNSEKAAQVTTEAVQNVSRASSRVDELGTAAGEIDNVIAVIMEIAEQTKLLALNATIEAARAGEAGKGFAVVANEVKELANQTNAATENIRVKIEAMQRSTEGTIGEITQIDGVIHEVNDIVTAIATAVEQQAGTTRDMASNIGQAATGLQDMTRTVSHVTRVSQNMAADMARCSASSTEMGTSSVQLNAHAATLAKMGDDLNEMVGRFTLDTADAME